MKDKWLIKVSHDVLCGFNVLVPTNVDEHWFLVVLRPWGDIELYNSIHGTSMTPVERLKDVYKKGIQHSMKQISNPSQKCDR